MGYPKSAQTFTDGFLKLLSAHPIHIVVWGNFPFNSSFNNNTPSYLRIWKSYNPKHCERSSESIPDDGFVKLLAAAPLPDTVQAVGVGAVGEDAKLALPGGLLHDDLHADAADDILALLVEESLLHLLLVLLQTCLENSDLELD